MTPLALFFASLSTAFGIVAAHFFKLWRAAEQRAERYRKQLVDHICPPSLAPINEIEARLALRKQCRDAGGVFHIRSA